MNACVVVTGDSKRVTAFSGGLCGITLRVEGVDPDIDLYVDFDSYLARQIGEALVLLSEALDQQECE